MQWRNAKRETGDGDGRRAVAEKREAVERRRTLGEQSSDK
jgi:hypothetical protein